MIWYEVLTSVFVVLAALGLAATQMLIISRRRDLDEGDMKNYDD